MAWDGETGARLGSPHTLSDPLTALDCGPPLNPQSSPSPFRVAVGYETGGIELLSFCTATDARRSLWRMPLDWCHMGLTVRQVALAPSGESVALATGGDDGIVRIFNINPRQLGKIAAK